MAQVSCNSFFLFTFVLESMALQNNNLLHADSGGLVDRIWGEGEVVGKGLRNVADIYIYIYYIRIGALRRQSSHTKHSSK